MIEMGLVILSLAIWIGLLLLRGQFWRVDQTLADDQPILTEWPTVCAVIPARNEADVLPVSLRSLLSQEYPGNFMIVLVDDQSTDGTAQVASQTAAALGKLAQLQILSGEPLPLGWTGKLWAMEQGTRQALAMNPLPDYLLLTDADIEHDPLNLCRLVNKAATDSLDLVSLMVRLRCKSFWEQLLIPAFVFFFQKLYPFRWVNNLHKSTAAAAGGCILLRQEALIRIGGLQILRDALIDDCTLAQKIKSSRSEPAVGIWLGLTPSTYSLRAYDSLSAIWDMVARTAFTQLHYSPWLLAGTLFAMSLVYLVAPIGTIIGILTSNAGLAIVGGLSWGLMSAAYWPMIRFYNCSPGFACSLPVIALLYTLMTLDSALRYWRGQGGAWKGRTYSTSTGQ
jgi:hopene-associated glycosyltransferase HpnB